MRVAVSGSSGQIVQALREQAQILDVDLVTFARPEADLARPEGIAAAIASLKPDAVINAAAYTAVDQAEGDIEAAMRINGEGAGAVAHAAAALGVPIVQISTDYVFDGQSDRPYREDDPTAPLSVYGQSKLAGERAVAKATTDSVIVRTSWIYSPFGRSFVSSMLSLAAQKSELRIVADNIGAPTNALDLAAGLLKMTRNLVMKPSASELRGIFHLTNAGNASSAEFASEIFGLSAKSGGPSPRVVPIPSSEYAAPARRPLNSRLDNAKAASLHDVVLPDWRQSLAGFMAQYAQRLRPESNR